MYVCTLAPATLDERGDQGDRDPQVHREKPANLRAAALEYQPAVSKTLKALVDRDAVTMQAAPDDARRREVALTPLGAVRATLDAARR